MLGLRIARSTQENNKIPWFTLGWIAILTLLFGWSQWGLSSRTQQMSQTKEKLLCFYLKHDYTIVPDKILKFFPKVLQKHTQRVQPFVEFYHRGGMAHEQARQWLREGEWNRSNLGFRAKGASCLQRAIAQGQLRKHPKKRIFMTMASMVQQDIQNNQSRLEKLGQHYIKSRQKHPWYGWGLVPADGDPVGLLSSIAFAPAWFTLLWQVLLLWLVAGFLEQRWGGPIWIAVFWLGGLLGSLTLFILQLESNTPILGSHNAIAGVMGMWTFATFRRPMLLTLPKPLNKKELPAFPPWLLTIAWLGLTVTDASLQNYAIVPHVIAYVLCFSIGMVVLWSLQSMEWLEALPLPIPETLAQPIKSPERRTQPRAFKKPTAGGAKGKSLYLKPDLKQMVKKAYKQGQYEEAVTMYRELYVSGQARIEDFDELFIASEKGQIEPVPDDFLRAIRAAAYSKRQDKALGYYHRCDNKRDVMEWSEREQISLAQELRRAGLLEEALAELESIMDEGPDGNFFMDALLLKIEIHLGTGDDLEEAFQLLYKAELYLEQKPQYKDAVERMRTLMADADGGSVPEIRQIPTGLGPGSFGLSDDGPLDQEVDASLLDDLAAFEQRLNEKENLPAAAGQSWSELPSLLLRDKEKQDAEANVRIADIDDEFLMGDSTEIPALPESAPPSPIPPTVPLDQKGNPDALFQSIEVNMDASMEFRPLEADTERTGIPDVTLPPDHSTKQAFSTLADENLLEEVLQKQAEFQHQQEQEASTQPGTAPDLAVESRPWESSWDNLPQSELPVPPMEASDPVLANTEYPYESLHQPGLETTAVPSLAGLHGSNAIHPDELLSEGRPNFPPSEPDPALLGSDFDLPLFGGEESLNDDGSKTMLSDDLQDAAEMAKALAGQGISLYNDPVTANADGATEEELPSLNHLESLRAGRPVLLLDEDGNPSSHTNGLTEHSKDEDNKG